MRPTIPWMQQAFGFYNKKYFGGRLKTPKFSLDCPYGNWGFYTPNGTFNRVTRRATIFGPGTLSLTSKYSRDEKDLIGTLLHEMIHMYINTVMLKYPTIPHGREFQELAQRLNQDGWGISEANEKKTTDTLDDGDEVEYNNMQIKPYIFCIIQQPNSNTSKIWGFKADYSNLNSYINTAKNLKQFGATSVEVYYCYSYNMENMPSSPQELNGIGANNFNDLIYKLSKSLNERLTKENFKQIKVINL